MTTIPIEVIVQDAEAPIVPSEDGTNNIETNIAVPDTGTISSSGDTSSSASSIILPAILLVLAIGTIVAILIHKYHKQKKDKTTRKERLAVATSSTIAILAAAVLVGNLVMPATKAATSVEPGTADLETEDKITIIATREQDSDEIIATVQNTSYATANLDFGYKVTASMAEGLDNANLYLDGDETSEYYFSPVEDGVLEDNTWGYRLSEEDEDYLTIPLANAPATIIKGNDNTIEDKPVDIYYAIKADNSLPAGTYTGEIEYTLTDNNFPSTLTTMQGMTTKICEDTYTPNAFKADGATIEDDVPTATLTDIRDNKTYTIAKLADGKCWMTQNLDLQKEDLIVTLLDSTNTDNPADGFELPDSQTSGSESWIDYNDNEGSINTAHVYDLMGGNQKFYYCARYSGPGEYCEEYSDQIIPPRTLGNYYNWYTATSGTGTYGLNSGQVAAGSICPAAWRLPSGSNNKGVTDYNYLLNEYGIYVDPTSGKMVEGEASSVLGAPFLLARTGDYFFGISNIDARGFLWTSMANNNYSGIQIYYSSKHVDSWGADDKRYGYPVRCLAK